MAWLTGPISYDRRGKLRLRYNQRALVRGAACAQKWGRMLVFVICGFIKNVLPNSYFIFQIPHVKSFKMMHFICLYFNYSVRYS